MIRVAERPGAHRLAEWDELVRTVPLSDVTQLSAWARLREHVGYRGVYVFADGGDGGDGADGADGLAGGAQILVRRVVGTGEVGYLSGGPLVSPAAPDPEAVHDALTGAIARLARERIRVLFVQPSEGGTRTSRLLAARGFRRSDAGIAPVASLRIDLRPDEAELRRGLSRSLRYWLNQWDKRGVVVRPSTEEDIPLMAGLLAATLRRQGAAPLFGGDYLAAMHRELAPAGHLVGFVGEAGGRPVAMQVLTGCGGVARARLAGFSPSDDVRTLNVPAAIDWACIRWARANGYRWYDFGGVRPESVPLLTRSPVDIDALPGPDRYKARFGGRLFRYPAAMELIRPAPLRLGYDLARRTAAGRGLVTHARRLARAGGPTRPRAGSRVAVAAGSAPVAPAAPGDEHGTPP